jgi:hypothetical protein
VRDKPGNTAFVDYQPGDTVAVSIPEEWADLALRIYAISLDEDENNNGEYNPTLEFLESEWNGQEPGSLGQSEEPPGGGGGCRGCPPLEPYEPQPPDTTYDPTDPGPTAEVYLARPVHGAGPIEHENDGDSQPAGWSASPILSDMAYQGSAGARTGIIVNRDGRADVRVQMGANLVGSNPELHSKLFKNGAEIGQEVDTASGFGFHTLFTSFTVDVAFVAGDIFTVTAEVYNGGALETGVYGQVGGPATNHGTGLFLTDIQWALPPGAVTPPVPGQQGNEQIAGTTASTTYTTNYPYLPGSLRVTVDGISVVPDETDPAAGEFELLIDATGKTVVVAYVIASATGTGATNPPPDPDAPGGGSGLTVEEEGTPLATAATTLDFVGAGVTASGTGAEKTITIPGGPALSGSTPVQDGGAGAAGSGTDASKADHKHPGDYVGIEFVIDGNGDPITTGAKGVLKVPFACTITESELEADTASNTTVTIKKRAFGGGAASSIVAAALPTLSGGTEAKDSTLSGWTTSVAAGDKLYWEVTTNDNATRITSALSARRT